MVLLHNDFIHYHGLVIDLDYRLMVHRGSWWVVDFDSRLVVDLYNWLVVDMNYWLVSWIHRRLIVVHWRLIVVHCRRRMNDHFVAERGVVGVMIYHYYRITVVNITALAAHNTASDNSTNYRKYDQDTYPVSRFGAAGHLSVDCFGLVVGITNITSSAGSASHAVWHACLTQGRHQVESISALTTNIVGTIQAVGSGTSVASCCSCWVVVTLGTACACIE